MQRLGPAIELILREVLNMGTETEMISLLRNIKYSFRMLGGKSNDYERPKL